MLLVDVREPNETAVERYPDAVIVPLSTFDPAQIPDPQGKRGGVRLPLRPPLGDRVAGGAGSRACRTMPIWPAASWPGRPPGCRPKRQL